MLLLMVIVAHFQEVSSQRRNQRTRMHVRPQKITSSFLPWLTLGKRRVGSASFKTNLAKTSVCKWKSNINSQYQNIILLDDTKSHFGFI